MPFTFRLSWQRTVKSKKKKKLFTSSCLFVDRGNLLQWSYTRAPAARCASQREIGSATMSPMQCGISRAREFAESARESLFSLNRALRPCRLRWRRAPSTALNIWDPGCTPRRAISRSNRLTARCLCSSLLLINSLTGIATVGGGFPDTRRRTACQTKRRLVLGAEHATSLFESAYETAAKTSEKYFQSFLHYAQW